MTTEPKYTDAQIEQAALMIEDRTLSPNDIRNWVADVIRSLLSERQAAMQGQGEEVVGDWLKGQVYRVATAVYFTAGIDQKNSCQSTDGVWSHRIECYGVNESDAVKLRDRLIELLNRAKSVRSVSDEDVEYADMYRWLREHFRFANDSLREIWFDAYMPVSQEDAKDLDREIRAAIAQEKQS
jgi:hypothetical protein